MLFSGLAQLVIKCCVNRTAPKQKREYTRTHQGCSIVWMILIYAAFILGAITSYMGGAIVSSSIWNVKNGTLDALNAASDTMMGLEPNIDKTFDTLVTRSNVVLNETADYIDFARLETLNVNSNLRNLADGFENIQTTTESLLGNSDTVKLSKVSASTAIDQLVTAVQNIDATVTSWSDQINQLLIPSPGGGRYYKTNPINTNGIVGTATNAKTLLSNSPDGVSQTTPLRTMPNLKTMADNLRVTIAQLQSSIRTKVIESGSAVRSSIPITLSNAKADTLNATFPVVFQVNTVLNNSIRSVTNMFSTVTGYETPRNIVMIMLSSILILILAFWSLFTGLKKPEPVKACSIASIPFYMLICLLSIILFVLATALGDCCTMAFGYNPPPLELFLPTTSSQIPSQIVNARASCVQNKSIVQIFTDLNFTTGANLNISQRASPLIDDLDFSGITNGLDLRQTITLPTTPTSALSPLLNLDLNGLVTNDLVTIRQTTFPNLLDQINNLKLAIEGILAQDDTTLLNSLTINGDNSISAAQNQQSAVGDFRIRLTAILVSINDLSKTGGTLDLLTTQITGLETLITNLKNQLQDLKTNAQSIPPYYDNAQSGMQTFTSQANTSILNSIPMIKGAIKQQFNIEQDAFGKSIGCYNAGRALFAVEEAVCSKTLGGFDSLWLSYSIIALFATVSIFAIPFAMNSIFQQKLRIVPEGWDKLKKGDKTSEVLESKHQSISIAQTLPAE